MKAENEMTLTFPSRSSNESFARAAVACFAAQLDPNLEELNDIKTAVSEAVTNCIVHAYRDCLGTMTGAQSRKIHTEPEWAWSLADQAHKLGIPVFMKEDLVPIIGDENMIQEMPEEFNKVLEVQKSWKK